MTRERQRLLRAWRDWVNCNPREMLTKVLPAIILKDKACSQMPWTVSSQARQTNDCFRANSDLPFLLDPFQRVCNGEKTDLLFKSCTFPDSVNVPVKESMEVGDELGDRYWNQKTQIWTQQSLNLIPSDYEVSEGVKEEGSSVCRSSASVTIGQWEEPASGAPKHQDSAVPGSASSSAGPVLTWGRPLPLFSSEGTALSGEPAQSLSQTGSRQVLGFPCFALGTRLSSPKEMCLGKFDLLPFLWISRPL